MASLVDIDGLQGQLPGGLKWLLAGMGGAAGFAWAQQQGSSVTASCILAGAAGGFCLVVLLFAGLRLVRGILILGRAPRPRGAAPARGRGPGAAPPPPP